MGVSSGHDHSVVFGCSNSLMRGTQRYFSQRWTPPARLEVQNDLDVHGAGRACNNARLRQASRPRHRLLHTLVLKEMRYSLVGEDCSRLLLST
jgi:hypothetical protein